MELRSTGDIELNDPSPLYQPAIACRAIVGYGWLEPSEWPP